ncbi:MAG: hypothetical protein ACJA2Q_001383 [Pseudohongiellaceae bacterium]|jgi:hypothetical protein
MKKLNFLRLLGSVCLPFALTACQSSATQTDTNSLNISSADLISCISVAFEFRSVVDSQEVGNASAPALAILPMFHSNRFLDLLAKEPITQTQTRQWFSQSAALGASIRSSENKNLKQPWPDSHLALINRCAISFATLDNYSAHRQQTLKRLSLISDHYDPFAQWLGFNWLLRPIFNSRIKKLHEDEKSWFEQTISFDESASYRPQETSHQKDSDLEEWFNRAYDSNPLKVPQLNDTQLSSLFALHSPRFTIELKDDNDLIGQPVWSDAEVNVNSDSPTVYTLPSLTRFGTSNLLQLNYVIWFSERKPTALFDLFAGKIDSLIWRVTLDEQGKVLLYDSIHSCGCYHKYFVMADNVVTKKPALSEEPANIFNLTDINSEAGVHIRLTANEHYVVGVNNDVLSSARPYLLADYALLSNLNDHGRSKSMFSPSGIIIDSKRLERYTLWPTGIKSVGAMRQWGTHATGFVEQQHLDDATLLDLYFLRLDKPR